MSKEACYWDIETEPLPLAELEKAMPEFTAAGNLKDPEKIKADIEAKRQAFIDNAALRAYTGKIVAVTAAWDDDEPIMQTGDEKDLIVATVYMLKTAISLNAKAYAWNGAGFDLPFLCQRAAVHSANAFQSLTVQSGARFNWNPCLIDPKLIWSNYSPDHTGTSLKTVSAMLGVGVKDGNGKDFAELLKTDKAKAESYAKNDVGLLRAVVKRMFNAPPQHQ